VVGSLRVAIGMYVTWGFGLHACSARGHLWTPSFFSVFFFFFSSSRLPFYWFIIILSSSSSSFIDKKGSSRTSRFPNFSGVTYQNRNNKMDFMEIVFPMTSMVTDCIHSYLLYIWIWMNGKGRGERTWWEPYVVEGHTSSISQSVLIRPVNSFSFMSRTN
jgi:hypothetical protein